jgi:hypothetical protein
VAIGTLPTLSAEQLTARRGFDARLRWLGRVLPAQRLILDVPLPAAAAGLDGWGSTAAIATATWGSSRPGSVPHRPVRAGRLNRPGWSGGTTLNAAVVAFEVDSYTASRREGWSVVVKGRAELVTDDATLARLWASGLQPWAAATARPDWIVIRADEISGRRL